MTEEPTPYEAAPKEKVIVLQDIGLRVRHRVANGEQFTIVEEYEDRLELFTIRGCHLTEIEAHLCHSAYQQGFGRGKSEGLSEGTEQFLVPLRLIGRALGDGLGEGKGSNAIWNALDNIGAALQKR
jgi:hypothetical protein